MTLAVNIAQGGSNNVTFRNKIINGAMVINQRGWSGNITTGNEYTLDRFQGVCSVSNKFSVSQSTSVYPAGFNFSLLVTSQSAYTVGAAEQFLIRQNIEAYNTNDLAWGTASAKTVTLSFQVYSSLTGTFGGALFNSNGSRSYPFTYSIPTANTWTTISITIAGDTSGTWAGTNGVGITVSWGLGVGSTYSGTAGSWSGNYYASATGATSVVGTSGATFYITGVQLEAGTTASPFEYRQFGQELALCQRYFEKTFSLTTAPAHNTGEFITWPNAGSLGCGGNTYITIQFNERKRATNATLRLYDPNASHTNSENWWRYWGGCGSGTAVGPNSGIALSATETFISGSLSASTGAGNSFNWTAESEL
jgi:hypothetical protein